MCPRETTLWSFRHYFSLLRSFSLHTTSPCYFSSVCLFRLFRLFPLFRLASILLAPPLPLGFLVSSRRFFSFPIKIFHRNLFVCWPRLCFFSRTCLHFRRYGYRVPSFLAITNHPIRFSLVIHTTKSPLVSTIFCEARYRLILFVSFILSHHFFVSFAIQFVVLRSFILPIFLSLSSRVYFVSSFYRYLYVRYCSRCFVKFCSQFYDTDTVCCFWQLEFPC